MDRLKLFIDEEYCNILIGQLELDAIVFKPKYDIDHDLCGDAEMLTRAGIVTAATLENSRTALDRIAKQRATEFRSMADSTRRRFPPSAFCRLREGYVFTIIGEFPLNICVSDAAGGTSPPVFRPKYAFGHETIDLEEQEARTKVVSKSSADREAEALTAIQQKWEAKLAKINGFTQRRLPTSAAVDVESECYHEMLD